MAKTEIENLKAWGVPEKQAGWLMAHLARAQGHVYVEDGGEVRAWDWLRGALTENLPTRIAGVLMRVARDNPPDALVEYKECGYDSCQSHRKLSKVVGEALLVGGVMHEAQMVGMRLDLEEAKSLVGSNLKVRDQFSRRLVEAASQFGAMQDFLFPGVTPSSKETPSLEQLAVATLSGQPKTTVRTLTGVGGLRSDRDWNYVTDFKTFVKLKVTEDKRYYPGIGLFFLLLEMAPEQVLAVRDVGVLEEMRRGLEQVKPASYQGVTVLCSAFVPGWEEMREMQGYVGDKSLELADAFHSPSYEFATLYSAVKSLEGRRQIDESWQRALRLMMHKLEWLWSFNSTIHLPWTANLAGLSNDLMGKITNRVGDKGLRYGVGYKGKSLEVREVTWGGERVFPVGLGLGQAYGARYYGDSDCFEGDYESFPVYPGSGLWSQIERSGFMGAALEFLKYE